jgi:hypothetical protein
MSRNNFDILRDQINESYDILRVHRTEETFNVLIQAISAMEIARENTHIQQMSSLIIYLSSENFVNDARIIQDNTPEFELSVCWQIFDDYLDREMPMPVAAAPAMAPNNFRAVDQFMNRVLG